VTIFSLQPDCVCYVKVEGRSVKKVVCEESAYRWLKS